MNLKIRAFKNQRIIFLVEFVSLAKLYSFACSFTWNFTPKIISIKIKWKWTLNQEKVSRFLVLFDWHVIQNSASDWTNLLLDFSTGKFGTLQGTKVPPTRATYNWEGPKGLWESLMLWVLIFFVLIEPVRQDWRMNKLRKLKRQRKGKQRRRRKKWRNRGN